MRKISKDGIEELKKWEGLRLEAYKDIRGAWTIGYGHTDGVKEGDKITAQQAETLLKKDLTHFEQAVNEAVKVDLSDNQFAALVSLAFNIGAAAFKGSTLVKKLNSGDYDSVPEQLNRWVYSGGKKLQGLINRRASEIGLWSRGSFVASQNVECGEPEPKQLHETREGKSAILAALGLLGSICLETAHQIQPLVENVSMMRYAFLILTFAGVGLGLLATMKRLKET
ncbi:phage related lysozyme [Bartonella australis AUST/NH1]|uniref:Lysozyme n=1 Tax=Bartonella australis (strain Aust/NH1) TaxID=1094489 RepID=M1NTU5_BARAA|nr:lysozyme [Bartonella australis]AGF74733.1 phage related lysozyme [Bartonella australis AUST/NH1]